MVTKADLENVVYKNRTFCVIKGGDKILACIGISFSRRILKKLQRGHEDKSFWGSRITKRIILGFIFGMSMYSMLIFLLASWSLLLKQ